MNDSNNNVDNNNNVTPMSQSNNATNANTISDVNNSVNNPNKIINNNDFNVNPTPTLSQNDISQNVTPLQQNYSNQQMNNSISNNANSIYSSPASQANYNNINSQQTMQANPNINVNQQQIVNSQIDDDELLKVFIGNNYDKITTKPFNFAGFFFSTFYMFYRKMFLYGLILFVINLIILNVINNFIVIVTILSWVVVGFCVNKVYLYFAKKKINKIKLENPQKNTEELKAICSAKGGTSVGKIFLGFLAELGITFVVLIIMMIAGIGSAFGEFLNLDNWNVTTNSNENDINNSTTTNGTLVENVVVGGYSCVNSKCNVIIYDSNNDSDDYTLNIDNSDLFNTLGDYKEYIKLNIYYTQKGNDKTIVDYKIYLKSNNEDISNVKTESELRDKIGLYSIGTHTDSFTLTEIGTTGFSYKNDTSYTYTTYTFIDSKNNEYEMKYINSNGALNLIEGNKYNVTFEVVEGTFDYEFNIISVK